MIDASPFGNVEEFPLARHGLIPSLDDVLKPVCRPSGPVLCAAAVGEDLQIVKGWAPFSILHDLGGSQEGRANEKPDGDGVATKNAADRALKDGKIMYKNQDWNRYLIFILLTNLFAVLVKAPSRNTASIGPAVIPRAAFPMVRTSSTLDAR